MASKIQDGGYLTSWFTYLIANVFSFTLFSSTAILVWKTLINNNTYWKYMEDVITPADATDGHQENKRFWSLFKHARTDLTGSPSLKHQGQTVSDPTDKAMAAGM